ncbi:glyoxylase-like metal-dependent hydrolase (beta-lactamase superfamily II) [Shimia isoporae]|uniref:Glyoxylase-like metal-dependent hydrolase (Beta-lactamase superfamily II) n=1 Tax=Shimia isoporae TaxID=647720 RepID=A0A4R1NP13_9RHOB|nr:MBL fold metallo-hydrolase [Shimia isoporae]TCL09569.1 glyoxylase-like metal-dependent hydrolase (beta-lactamase superfamily II) [Shimia isoporae]
MDAEILAFDPTPGKAEMLEPGLRRILAPNPSPMTFRGTNTYILGDRGLCVIDPGPDSDAHLQAILASVGDAQQITHVVVTHAHIDHSPLAGRLAKEVGAQIWAFGGPDAGRSAVMAELADRGLAGGGEGVDGSFVPDVIVAEGDVISGDDWSLEVIHTPGHFGNHIALAWGDACFVGDHVMGWASSLVSPPDGDLTDFMNSCAKLHARPWRVFHAGHGAPIEAPHERLDWLVSHRSGREAEILDALAAGSNTAEGLARCIYTETPSALLPAATRNVFAHLVDLVGKNMVSPIGELRAEAVFERL